MPLLVTGATGFLGGHLVDSLTRRGESLRALVRPGTAAEGLGRRGVEVVRGDVRDADAVRRAVEGCRGVYHAAAVTGWARDPSTYEPVNVGGTRNVLAAARETGVERLLHTSSIVTIGEAAGEVAREETRRRRPYLREYERTKSLAEEAAREAAGDELQVVIVNPTGVVGPGNFGLTGQVLIAYLEGRLPSLPETGNRVNLVHGADVAEGMVAAYERGRTGERYILGGDNLTIGEMFDLCRQITGIDPPGRTLPRPITWILAALFEGVGKVTGRTPPVTRDLLRVARHGIVADSSKARDELGYSSRGARETLEDTLRWYVEAGHARPRGELQAGFLEGDRNATPPAPRTPS